MNTRDHTQDDGQLLRPDTGMLHPSPTNPRKTFAEEPLREMAESIRQVGVMQPIIVREMPEAMRLRLGTEARLEIVAGERRWRSANIAGLPTVPVLLRDLTDEQVIAHQIIENLQREDLNAIDEAEGFGTLQAQGMSGPQIAEAVGKDKAYVYAKLKLLALCEHGRTLLRQGELIESIALLVARIPVEEFQLDALKYVTQRDPDTGEAPSFRGAKAHIQQRYTKNLSKAPFDTTDSSLVAGAGNCIDCPSRLGNQPECPSGSENVCTNAKCHELKRQAHNVRLLALPDDTPRVEIPGSNRGPINYTDYDNAGYRLLSSINYHDKRNTGAQRSYADWLKENGESVPVAVHVDPFNGDVKIIARITDLIAAAERIEVKHTDQAGQQRLDVAAEQIAPASTAVERIEATPAPTAQAVQARIDKEREQRKPAARQNSALEIAYAKYRQAVADEIINNPPLMIAGPLLHIVARYAANNANVEFESDGQAMQVLINVIASAFAKSTHSSLHLDSIESLAESVGINATTLLDKHVPVPDGCARPNQHGVYPTQDRVKRTAGPITIHVKLAKTADGWRGATEISSPTSEQSGPICDRNPAFPTREEALVHCAKELKASLSSAHYPKKSAADLINWLTKFIDDGGVLSVGPSTDTAKETRTHMTPMRLGQSVVILNSHSNRKYHGQTGVISKEIVGRPNEYIVLVGENKNPLHACSKHLRHAEEEQPAPRSAHVRYRHPENSAIGWSGHGRKPQWVVEWLAQGKALADIECKPQEAA